MFPFSIRRLAKPTPLASGLLCRCHVERSRDISYCNVIKIRDSSTSLGMTKRTGTIKKACAVARLAFDDYLFRREGTGSLGFSRNDWVHGARVVRGRLQQSDP